MNKPFKIINLENFEIELLEDLKKGTRINLKSYINDNQLNDLLVSLNKLIEDKYIDNKVNEKIELIKKDYHLKEKELNIQIDNRIKEVSDSLKENFNIKLKEKDDFINELKSQKKSIEDNRDLSIAKEVNIQKEQIVNDFNKLLEEERVKNNDLEHDIKKINENQELLIENAKLKLKQELENEIAIKNNENSRLKDEIDRLKREKNSYSIKHAGTEFEKWCKKQLQDHFELVTKDTTVLPAKYIKDEDSNQKSASDLIVEIKPNPKLNKVYKIVLEMKTECLDTKLENRKTNEYHIPQLLKDMKKNKAEFGVLVTELEPEDNFTIKRPTHIDGGENIYIIRPHMLVSFIQLIRLFFLKFADFENYEIEFQKKEDILELWDDFKQSFNTTFEHWRKNVVNIVENAKKIKKLSEEIINTIEGVSETHINSLINKVNDFKINKKIIKKIEDLEE